MRLSVLPLLAASLTAAAAAEVSKSMPPFLIGNWQIGALLPFVPNPDVIPLAELDAMLAGERTVHITPSSIAFIPRFKPASGGGSVTAVADEKRLSDLADLDPSAVAGTSLARGEATMAVVAVTPAECPHRGVEVRGSNGKLQCSEQVFFSPDGFKQEIYLWLPGAIAPLHKTPG